MKWPSRGRPELHHRGKWWVVRWYDPVAKRARALRTQNEAYARKMWELMTEEVKP